MKRPAFFLSIAFLACWPGCMAGVLPAIAAAPAVTTGQQTGSPPVRTTTATGTEPMSITPFLQMARESPCHQVRNRLFLIDNILIFWDRIGHCPDNAREQTLFGSSVDTVLATSHDSIAGPIKKVNDETYRALFETIMANREASDLGLGTGHQVRLLPL